MQGRKNNELSIVLPVFNEERVIEKTIQEIHDYMLRHGIDAQIIAVDDGSTDGTATVLNDRGRFLPDLKVISHQKNEGYGSALRSGIRAAQKKWILLMDSDGQFRIDSLQAVWPHGMEADLWLGYRQKRKDNYYRSMIGKLGNSISNIFLGRCVRDINCGFKLFKKDLICPIALSSSGGIINFEILYKLFRITPSVIMRQFPVDHYPRTLGKAKGGSLKGIIKIIAEGVRVMLGQQ